MHCTENLTLSWLFRTCRVWFCATSRDVHNNLVTQESTRAFKNFFFVLDEHKFTVHRSLQSKYHHGNTFDIAFSIFLRSRQDPSGSSIIFHYSASVRYNPTVLQWPLNLSVSLHRLLCATPTHHSASLQRPEKASPNSVKGSNINIKKIEESIRTDVWYYGICKSIYELCDAWYRNQEAITVLRGRS